MSAVVLRARWIVPVTSPPIEDGRLVIAHGRIAAVERARTPDARARDYGDAIILPGLVNAHTHLELTRCRGRVPYGGGFVDWLERLMSMCAPAGADSDAAGRQAIRDGLHESLAAGVTLLADIGHGRRALEMWPEAPVNVVGLLETLGMGPKASGDHDLAVGRAISFYRAVGGEGPGVMLQARNSLLRLGVCPHAPYSTDPRVYRAVVEFAARARCPVATHLAETREEWQFLQDGTGPFRDLLERRGLWDGSFTPPGCSAVRYAEQLGLLSVRAILAHVNYASDADLDLLARGNASVVYCPRCHAFFQHDPHRWGDMWERGINVGIGTDSLASNDSLGMLDELRFAYSRDLGARADRLLAMGTMAGARALGLESECGSLDPGKRADLIVVPLPRGADADPLDSLLAGGGQPAAVYVNGENVHHV